MDIRVCLVEVGVFVKTSTYFYKTIMFVYQKYGIVTFFISQYLRGKFYSSFKIVFTMEPSFKSLKKECINVQHDQNELDRSRPSQCCDIKINWINILCQESTPAVAVRDLVPSEFT